MTPNEPNEKIMNNYEPLDFGYQQVDTFTPEQQSAYPSQGIDLSNDSRHRDLNAVITAYAGDNASSFSSTVTTFNASDLAKTDNPDDFLKTARNNSGPARGNLQPSSIVKYQGMDISLEVMETMGLVYRHPDSGRYINPLMATDSQGYQPPAQANQQQQEQQQANKLEAGVELFHAQDEAAYQSVKANVPEHVHDMTISKVLAHGVDSLNMADVARDTGLTVAEASNTVKGVLQLFTTQANTLATQMGMQNPQHCWDWLQTNRPQQLQAAQQALVHGRSTAELRDCIKLYGANVTTDTPSLKGMGHQMTKGSNGETLVKIGNTWTTVAAATRAGLI